MKKSVFLVFCTLIVFGLMAGLPSLITVNVPNGSTTWNVGTSQTITWTADPSISGTNVKIRLMKGHGGTEDLILAITDSTSNTGSYSWAIPASLTPGSYLIRVKTIDNNHGDDGDFFTMAPATGAASPTGKFQKTPGNIKKMIKYTVEVLKPKKGTILSEGSTLHIRWRSNYKGAWKIGLFRDGKTKVADLSGPDQHSGELHQMKCVIPKGASAYPFRRFKVRVGTPNPMSKIFAWSPTITIKAPQEVIERGLYAAERHNCGIGKKTEYAWGSYSPFGTGAVHPSKPGTSRVGFEHHYKEEGAMWYYVGYNFRSWIKFDLSEFVGKSGIVRKAILKISKTETKAHPGQGNISCCSLVYKLTSSYSGASCLSTSGENLASLPTKDGKSSWEVDMRSTVRKWINNPGTNFGLQLISYQENHDHDNQYCVTYYKTKLIVEYVVSEE